MIAFFNALLLALIGGINLNFHLLSEDSAKWLKGWAIRAGVFFIPLWIYVYFGCPPRIGAIIASELLVLMVVNLIITSFGRDLERGEWSGDSTSLPKLWMGGGAFALVYGFIWIISGPVGSSSSMHSMLGHGAVQRRTSLDDWKEVDRAKIVQVDSENAYFRAKQVLGDYKEETLGSRFFMSGLTNQKLGDRQVWVTPLDYQDFWKWSLKGYVPAYVRVDAQNPDVKGELVSEARGQKLSMRYMPGGCFGDNLERHIYNNGYSGYFLYPHFETMDDGYPMWVVTLTSPSSLFWVPKINGVLLVDPQTGKIEEFMGNPHDLELPEWVDRVEPGCLTATYAEWYGTYHRGWWAAARGENVSQPGDIMKFVVGSDGRTYFFTSMTSSSEHDRSAVSYLMVDSKTGAAYEYPASGPEEGAICTTINNYLKMRHFHATRPIIYNLFGRMVWGSPVDGEGHTYQGMAFVDLEDTTRVAFGESLEQALDAYQAMIANDHVAVVPGKESTQKTFKFRVLRKGFVISGTTGTTSTFFHFMGEGYPSIIFEVNARFDGASVTEIGDEIEVGVYDTNEGLTRVRSFRNLTVPLRASK